jgi:RNA polymerase sigma factor for flagellar operon FliA
VETDRRKERSIDGLTREQACEAFRDRIALMARRLAARIPAHSDLGADDLRSHGALGLLEAFDRFEPGRGVSFQTFADFRIRGAMMDACRAQDAFTRHRRQSANRIESAVQELTRENGRPPASREIAARMDIDLERYWQAANDANPVVFRSIHHADGDDGLPLEELLGARGANDALHGILATEVMAHLAHAIAALPDRPRKCLTRYYLEGRTLVQIAAELGVTHSRVSQILTQTRGELRRALAPDVDESDLSLRDAA